MNSHDGRLPLHDTRNPSPDSRFPIVDAHQHFWDPTLNYHPWLCDEPLIAFRYGDYRSIRRAYLPPDYLADAAGYAVQRTVYVETEWDPNDPVAEMRYVRELRERWGLPSVAVAAARMDHPEAPRLLETYARFDFVRGVRHKPPPGALMSPDWRRGFAALAALGLRFDLQAPWAQLGDAVRLANDFPDTRIIINHAALPADRSEAGLEGWAAMLRQLADCSNIVLKISGIGQPGARWSADENRRIVLTAIEAFGAERCMFASNFPVDSLCASFADIYDGFRAIVADFSPDEQSALFVRNAVRIYGID